jgi:hypothetical protein
VLTSKIPGASLTQRLHASLHYLGASAISRLLKNSMAESILTTKILFNTFFSIPARRVPLRGAQRHQKKLTKFPGSHLHFLVPWWLDFLFLSVLAAFSGNFNYLLHWRLRSENYSPYSVANDRHVEINKKPETFAAKFQIGQKLSLEQWQEFLDCLEFNNDLVIDQQVQSQPAINSYVVVCDWQDYLGLKVNFAFVQFVTQTLLVD